MSEYFLPAYKFHQLFDYLDKIQADTGALAAELGLDSAAMRALDARQGVPAIHYSRLYLASTKHMESHLGTVPWAAGMGSSSFRLMCFTMISSATLGDAIRLGEEFCAFASALSGHSIWLDTSPGDEGLCAIGYDFASDKYAASLAPAEWERSEYFAPVVLSSGLRMLCSLYGWLIGRSVQLQVARVAAPDIGERYCRTLERTFRCPVEFGAERSEILMQASELHERIVQDKASLEHFLSYVLYQFWLEDQEPNTTSQAIQSIINNLPDGEMPHFDAIAERLNMSTSTLRRRLMNENTSYQQIKDDCRKSMALEYLHQHSLKIHEIGDMLGFAETSSFVRSFRKWTGMTPKAYRDSTSAFSSPAQL